MFGLAPSCPSASRLGSRAGNDLEPITRGRIIWHPSSVTKTTVDLPDNLKSALERKAKLTGRSEGELIREAVRALVAGQRPRPKGGLFDGDDTTLSEHTDEALAGFGER
jgi:predicted transcriptional regulator